MFVVIHHNITDSQKWGQITEKIGGMVERRQLPKGVCGLSYLPSTDGRHADCLWETDSLENLKRFLDPEIGTAARNEYFQVDATHAFGLPGQTAERKAA